MSGNKYLQVFLKLYEIRICSFNAFNLFEQVIVVGGVFSFYRLFLVEEVSYYGMSVLWAVAKCSNLGVARYIYHFGVLFA